MNIRGALGEKAKRCAHAIASVAPSDPLPIRRNAQRRKTESRGSDTGYIAMRFIHDGGVGSRAIEHQPGIRIGLLPEITKRPLGKVFKK